MKLKDLFTKFFYFILLLERLAKSRLESEVPLESAILIIDHLSAGPGQSFCIGTGASKHFKTYAGIIITKSTSK